MKYRIYCLIAILFSVEGTHIVVFSGTSSHGTLVVGSIHHVTSHFKGTLQKYKYNAKITSVYRLNTPASITVV